MTETIVGIISMLTQYTKFVKNDCRGYSMGEILPQRLRECRKKMGFTQWEVAVYCDITEKAYQNYELARREPKVVILMRIARFYKVSMDYLVGLTDDPTPYARRSEEEKT